MADYYEGGWPGSKCWWRWTKVVENYTLLLDCKCEWMRVEEIVCMSMEITLAGIPWRESGLRDWHEAQRREQGCSLDGGFSQAFAPGWVHIGRFQIGKIFDRVVGWFQMRVFQASFCLVWGEAGEAWQVFHPVCRRSLAISNRWQDLHFSQNRFTFWYTMNEIRC